MTSVQQPARLSRRWMWMVLVAVMVGLQLGFRRFDAFPASLDTAFSDPLDSFAAWAQRNRYDHWLFGYFFNPIADIVEWGLDSVESVLLWVPWFVLPIAIFLFVARTRSWGQATAAGLAMLYPGLVGLWEVTVETLALMTVAVVLSVMIGVPLGVLGAMRPAWDSAMRPILDSMQTIPAPVYFVPMALFFGIGAVPAALATVIYALPPVVRLTTLGLREVPVQTVEASTMFGAEPNQTLRKVQLPMALPTIMTGVTSAIMMALGIIVLATLLGAGGLGQEVMETLSSRRTGRGIGAGLAVVAVAMVLDRMGRAAVGVDRASAPSRRVTLAAIGIVGLLIVAGRVRGDVAFPEVWDTKIFDPIDDGVRWFRDNFRWLTRGTNDLIVSRFYVPSRDFLTESVAGPVLVFLVAFLGWRLRGWRFGLFCLLSLLFVGLIGMWELSVDTFTQVFAAVVLSVLIAVPVGVLVGRSRRAELLLSPFLDGLQTIPSLVYIIPAVSLFTIGVVPGIIASVLYAIVPGIRITALGIRQVPSESIEASTMFGATPFQTMRKVRIPLAAPTIAAAINQVIMMVLAMVIISGLVGGGGLGFETISAVKNSEVGLGFEVGFSIVVMAIILDRVTQAFAERLRPPE